LFVYLGYSQDGGCIIDAGVELIPAPTPDPLFTGFSTYPSETTVQMCYTVDQYNTSATMNWMHGIVPLFGPGWDLSTLQPVGQPETDFWDGGEWIWVEDITAGVTGEFISGPGWFFDAESGGGTLNGDPTDNWGDGNNGPWTFCWEITTQSCPPAFNEANLIVEILNFADSETGSWADSDGLNQCIDDPSYYIQGVQLDCPTCDESDLTIVNPTCQTINETGGLVVVTPVGFGPWNYIWFNLDSGEIVEENNQVTLPITVSGLTLGEYVIQVEDLGFPGGCSSAIYFEISVPSDCMIYGCTNIIACNYNIDANTDDGSCEYAEEYYDCEGNCLEDLDEDGVCDSCETMDYLVDEWCNCDIDLEYAVYYTDVDEINCVTTQACYCVCNNDSDEDGVCDELDDCIGQFDECGECNGNGPQLYYDCYGNCLVDFDQDGMCDELDNCPEYYNPDQEDFNNDGIGDACDGIGLIEKDSKKNLLITIDILGRETIDHKGFQLQIYDDGSVEKKYLIK